ncbi:hypothetical protein M3P05_01750 [Sansalvadorimonas sp. 2012CJ34-2]|uniref:Uncharacterized protein n=1 Tax=Parendozoicomonas callyspongiae TaxID=2942213 RepID=A0ABT0PBB5_9GAMM|nr:hypothetical protein [Sansalvadorimonas sp. 2012CJ34-2]MCL6268677.1 hypothetical protein [Sansalvadorimonas sp. 2012CJ34-2]
MATTNPTNPSSPTSQTMAGNPPPCEEGPPQAMELSPTAISTKIIQTERATPPPETPLTQRSVLQEERLKRKRKRNNCDECDVEDIIPSKLGCSVTKDSSEQFASQFDNIITYYEAAKTVLQEFQEIDSFIRQRGQFPAISFDMRENLVVAKESIDTTLARRHGRENHATLTSFPYFGYGLSKHIALIPVADINQFYELVEAYEKVLTALINSKPEEGCLARDKLADIIPLGEFEEVNMSDFLTRKTKCVADYLDPATIHNLVAKNIDFFRINPNQELLLNTLAHVRLFLESSIAELKKKPSHHIAANTLTIRCKNKILKMPQGRSETVAKKLEHMSTLISHIEKQEYDQAESLIKTDQLIDMIKELSLSEADDDE